MPLLAPADQAAEQAPCADARALVLADGLGLDLSRCPCLGCMGGRRPWRATDEKSAVQVLLAACGIGETMFLRHPEQLAALVRLAPTLPGHDSGAPLSVWSAGCSTGEEAYSLAAVLSGIVTGGVEVLGTDANAAAVACARQGRYRPWSLRGRHLDDPEVAWWLEASGQEIAVRERLRERVRFAVHNLASDPYPAGFDVIFCRNVLLYFRADAAATVLGRFADSLRPGGLLFLGHADATPTDSAVWEEELWDDVRVYRRRADCLPAAVSPTSAGPTPAPERDGAPTQTLLTRARELAGQRALHAAIALLDPLSETNPLLVEPHVLLALVAAESGQPELGLRAARRACFLAPDSAMTHYLMAQALRSAGESRQVARHVEMARARLALLPSDDAVVPHGEGLTRRQLRRILDGFV